MRLRAALIALLLLLPTGQTASAGDGSSTAPAATATATAAAQGGTQNATSAQDAQPTLLEQIEARKLTLLPAGMREGLYTDVWGWGSYLNAGRGDHQANGDGQLSLDITKSFGGRVALTTELSLLAANEHARFELESAYASVLVSEPAQIVATAGKFEARIGVEGRDFWERQTGTTSLLFAAEPQSVVGAMLRVPVGHSGWTLRPFLATDFEGSADIAGAPAGGLAIEYKPSRHVELTLTNWVGPGYAPESLYQSYGRSGAGHSGAYSGSGYGASYASAGSELYGGPLGPVENWLGPDLVAEHDGMLYFVDGKIVWRPETDLMLAGEALLASTSQSEGTSGWQGCLALLTYDLTDRWRLFGRWSFLNDADGLVTGTAQRRHELSVGLSYRLRRELELRGEYRHDFSNTQGDLNTLSIHVLLHL